MTPNLDGASVYCSWWLPEPGTVLDGSPTAGELRLRPLAPHLRDPAEAQVIPQREYVIPHAGSVDVSLPSADPDLFPQGWAYEVTETFDTPGLQDRKYQIILAPGQRLNLATVDGGHQVSLVDPSLSAASIGAEPTIPRDGAQAGWVPVLQADGSLALEALDPGLDPSNFEPAVPRDGATAGQVPVLQSDGAFALQTISTPTPTAAEVGAEALIPRDGAAPGWAPVLQPGGALAFSPAPELHFSDVGAEQAITRTGSATGWVPVLQTDGTLALEAPPTAEDVGAEPLLPRAGAQTGWVATLQTGGAVAFEALPASSGGGDTSAVVDARPDGTIARPAATHVTWLVHPGQVPDHYAPSTDTLKEIAP